MTCPPRQSPLSPGHGSSWLGGRPFPGNSFFSWLQLTTAGRRERKDSSWALPPPFSPGCGLPQPGEREASSQAICPFSWLGQAMARRKGRGGKFFPGKSPPHSDTSQTCWKVQSVGHHGPRTTFFWFMPIPSQSVTQTHGRHKTIKSWSGLKYSNTTAFSCISLTFFCKTHPKHKGCVKSKLQARDESPWKVSTVDMIKVGREQQPGFWRICKSLDSF